LLLEEGDPAPEEDPEGTGTLEDPYNPKAAYDVALALESGAKTENDVYIKGKVCSVKYTFNAQYGTATFNISQDGTTVGVQFPCYSVLYLGNKAWEEGDSQVAVGDEVIICGKLTNYQGNTPETASKEAYVYSINGQTSIEKSDVFGVESKDVNVSATATSAVVKVTGNVAWTASSTATIDKTSGEGAAEITVNFAANEDTENSKTYTVTLTTAADVAEKEIVVTITQSKARSADEHYVKIETTKALSWSTVSDDTYKEGRSVTVDDVTVTAYRNTSNTGFDNFLQDNHIRIFKNYVLKIDAGATITKVILNCAFSDKCFNITAIDGTVGVADTSAKTVTWEGSLNPFIAEMTGGQNRVASIEVYFE
ncbi:MAG: BACON domain-containing protein, partial [Bacteroidales bacterium]|nr:BACON domain-containing protein [Bacteroidales bacterium]